MAANKNLLGSFSNNVAPKRRSLPIGENTEHLEGSGGV